MGKMRAVIVDDEAISLQRLKRLIYDSAEVELVGEAESGDAAIDTIRRTSPDVVFLDVQIPEVDGFGVVECLRNDPPPLIVFVTAYDEYAVRAFKANAVDYLLKPIDSERLSACLARVKKQVSLLRSERGSSRSTGFKKERLVVKCDRSYKALRLRDVSLIEAAGNYVVVHTPTETFTVRETLGAIEARLHRGKFVRIHRSAIINVDLLAELVPISHGEYSVVMQTGQTLTMTRRYREALMDLISLSK